VNALGGDIFTFALSLKLLKVTGSAFGYGTSLFIGPIIGLLVAPIIGKIVNNYSHKKVALISEACLIITLIIYLFAFIFLQRAIFYTAIVAVCFINVFARLFSIAYLSSTPQIVSTHSIQRLNSIQTTGVAMSSIVAAPLAGFLFGIISFTWIILIEIVTESLTWLITWWTHIDKVKNVVKMSATKTSHASVIKILRQQPQLVLITMIAMILNLTGISLEIGIPYVLIHMLKYSTAVSGNVQGVMSFGVFLGGIFISFITIKNVFKFTKTIYWLAAVQLLILGLLVKFLPNYTLVLFVVFEFINGISGAISDPPIFTYIQEVIPGEALGRVNTLMYTVVQILNPIGVLIYSTSFNGINLSDCIFD